MKETINDKIASLLPDLKQSLKEPGEEVIVGGVTISRLDAERICEEFEKQLNEETDIYDLNWDIIPLKLSVANRNWRSLQESLNQFL